MTTYYTPYQIPQVNNLPLIVRDWIPLVGTVEVPNLYISPRHNIPMAILPQQIVTPLSTPVNCPHHYPCSYNCPVSSPDQLVGHAVPNIVVNEIPGSFNLYSPENEPILSNVQEDIENFQSIDNTDEEFLAAQTVEEAVDESNEDTKDPVEYYLALPKDLFPTARMLAMDPNFIIDEFCKIPGINENFSWILDLEFGIPRVPVTRAIAVYDVGFNRIHCKNTPSAIHPGFEKCSEDFKRVLLFYYDCIVSTWYKGYIILNHDSSVENFQSWLLIPMLMLGMCWR